jgi:hypothetical protein
MKLWKYHLCKKENPVISYRESLNRERYCLTLGSRQSEVNLLHCIWFQLVCLWFFIA